MQRDKKSSRSDAEPAAPAKAPETVPDSTTPGAEAGPRADQVRAFAIP